MSRNIFFGKISVSLFHSMLPMMLPKAEKYPYPTFVYHHFFNNFYKMEYLNSILFYFVTKLFCIEVFCFILNNSEQVILLTQHGLGDYRNCKLPFCDIEHDVYMPSSRVPSNMLPWQTPIKSKGKSINGLLEMMFGCSYGITC